MNLLENGVDRRDVGVCACVCVHHRERQIALTYWRPQVWSKLLAGLASILRRLFYTSNTLRPRRHSPTAVYAALRQH